MLFNIDLDRGVHTRVDPATGMDVHMYVDTPGVYLSSHGTEIHEELARRAGFPIEEHAKKRRIKEALSAAKDKVMAELAEADAGEKVVLAEKDGFKVLDIGYERYQVISPDGDLLTPNHLDKHSALILLDQLAPTQVKEPDAEPEADEV